MQAILPEIENALNVIRPYLHADGGDVEIISFNEELCELTVKWIGACSTCDMSEMTLKAGIEETIKKAVPSVKKITAIR